jgi:hypothetical protein
MVRDKKIIEKIEWLLLLILLIFGLLQFKISVGAINDKFVVHSTMTAIKWETIEFKVRDDKKAVEFKVDGIKDYQKLEYEITYIPENRPLQGITGSFDLHGEDSMSKNDIMLGTESSGDWVYDTGMDKIKLKVTLSAPNKVLEKEIDY